MWSQKPPHSCFVIFNVYIIYLIDNGKEEKLFK